MMYKLSTDVCIYIYTINILLEKFRGILVQRIGLSEHFLLQILTSYRYNHQSVYILYLLVSTKNLNIKQIRTSCLKDFILKSKTKHIIIIWRRYNFIFFPNGLSRYTNLPNSIYYVDKYFYETVNRGSTIGPYKSHTLQ